MRQLLTAVKGDNLPLIRSLIKLHKLDVNYRFDEWSNRTLLHVAAAKGYLDVVNSLVEEFQADVNIEDDLGEVPRHAACNFERIYVMQYLIEIMLMTLVTCLNRNKRQTCHDHLR